MSGFESTPTAVLAAVRENLLTSLDRVADHLSAGTFNDVGPKGSAPASQSGHLTLALLKEVDAELDRRREGVALPSDEELMAHARRVVTEMRKPPGGRWYNQDSGAAR